MRCLCGKSKSYIVTTIKSPVLTKVSTQRVVSAQNGISTSPTGTPSNQQAININPLTNTVATSQTTTTQVQIHNNHNEEVTRYQDTAKTVAKEFSNLSISNNSTPEGTLKQKSKAPQPTTTKSQVTPHKILESQEINHKTLKNEATYEKITESQVVSHKSSEVPMAPSASIIITESSQTPEKNTSLQETSNYNSLTVAGSKSESSMVTMNVAQKPTMHTSPTINSLKLETSSLPLPVSQDTTMYISPTADLKSETLLSTIPATEESTTHTSSTINSSKLENRLSSMSITQEVTMHIPSTAVDSKSDTSMPITEETLMHSSSTVNSSKSEICSSSLPVSQETAISMSSKAPNSKSEMSLLIIPVTEEATMHTSHTKKSSKTEMGSSPITENTTIYISSTAVDSNSNTSWSKIPATRETVIHTSSTMVSSKSETSLLSVPSPTNSLSKSSSTSSMQDLYTSATHQSLESIENLENLKDARKASVGELIAGSNRSSASLEENVVKRRSGVQVSVPAGPEVTGDEELPVYKKSPEDEEKIKKAIEKNEFLNRILSGKRLQDIINAMQPKNVIAKQKLIKQGETGSEMFVSKEGTYKILIKGKVVGEFNDARVFGELAILYNAQRLASIQAATSGKVWVLARDVYRKVVISSNLKEQDENLKFLQNVKSLNVVDVEVLRQVSNLLKPEFMVSGTVIIRQGDKGDKFYIIRAGTVTISKTGEGILGKLGKGECFGEMALQKEDTRQATVTAEAPGVECLTLRRADFINHFGDVEIPKIEVKKTSFRNDVQSEHQDIKLEDLKIIKTLGVGGFGRVELVQHKKKKALIFALKYLKKIDIVYQNQQEHVYNEKLIQMNSKSPFIVRLYRTYKDNKYVYFLMESCLGGDLFSLLHKQKGKRFDEKDARFLSACVLEALEHLHSKGVVYRDLKPENLLIDKNGYIKLTDFGFAKKMPARGKTFTFAGTPEYVAPEIVLNRGHDKAVDYWAFGAFVFELLTGRTPFRTGDSSHMRTYNKILNGIDNVNFPTYMNQRARNLIEKLCRPVPAERLGMQRGGTRDIKAHKWYQGFDWIRFQQCQIPSAFKPKLRDVTDTSNFDFFKPDKDYPPDETSGWDINF